MNTKKYKLKYLVGGNKDTVENLNQFIEENFKSLKLEEVNTFMGLHKDTVDKLLQKSIITNRDEFNDNLKRAALVRAIVNNYHISSIEDNKIFELHQEYIKNKDTIIYYEENKSLKNTIDDIDSVTETATDDCQDVILFIVTFGHKEKENEIKKASAYIISPDIYKDLKIKPQELEQIKPSSIIPVSVVPPAVSMEKLPQELIEDYNTLNRLLKEDEGIIDIMFLNKINTNSDYFKYKQIFNSFDSTFIYDLIGNLNQKNMEYNFEIKILKAKAQVKKDNLTKIETSRYNQLLRLFVDINKIIIKLTSNDFFE
jgi:hypothetical protein